MRNLFKYVGLRHLKYRPVRTFLTSLGVALGVSLFVAIQIINRSTSASFKESIEATAGKAQLIIVSGETGFSEGILKDVIKTPGVAHAVPMIQTRVFVAGKKGAPSEQSLYILGVDLLKEQSVRTYKVSDETPIDDPLVFLNQPDSIILTHTFADANHLEINSAFEIATAHGKQKLVVRGLLTPEGPAKAYGGSLGIMDIDGAAYSFGKVGKFDRIDIVVKNNATVDSVRESLEKMLGAGFKVEKPETQVQGASSLIESYQVMLTFFSTLALLVGVFLVFNSVSISVAERRREIGVLRAMGATRGGILTLFLSEAFVMGLVGAVVGIGIGRAMASQLTKMVAESLSAQYLMDVKIHKLVFSINDVLKGLAVGVFAAMIAAFWPSLKATMVKPLEAMKRIETQVQAAGLKHFLGPFLWVGVVIMIHLNLASYYKWGAHFLLLDHLNGVLGIVGPALLGPAIVAVLVVGLRRIFLKRTISRIASDNLLQNPKRTSSNVTTLMVGLTLVIIVTSVSWSFNKSITDWFDRVLHGDFLVSSYGKVVDFDIQPLHEDVGRDIEKVPGVLMGPERGAYALRFIHFFYEGKQLGLKAIDEPNPKDHYNYYFIHDRSNDEAGHDLFHSQDLTILVSENFVLHLKKKTGDVINLPTPQGLVAARIVGVVTDFASPEGVIYMDRKAYKKYWNDPLVEGFTITAAPGVDKSVLRSEIDKRFGRSRNLMIISNQEMRHQIIESIDQGFGYTRAIQWAALAVALLSLLNTLLISILERTRELGMLRAVGMTRKQMISLIVQEAILQGGLGAFVAVFLGAWISKLWIVGSLSYVLGWIVNFSFPWASIFSTVGLGVMVTFIAGIYPAWRASRIEIKEALEYE